MFADLWKTDLAITSHEMRQIKCIDVITSIIRADFLWSAPSSENNSIFDNCFSSSKISQYNFHFRAAACQSLTFTGWQCVVSDVTNHNQPHQPTPSQHIDHHPLVNMVSWFSSKCRKLHFTCLPVVYCHMLSNIFIDFLLWTIALSRMLSRSHLHTANTRIFQRFFRDL